MRRLPVEHLGRHDVAADEHALARRDEAHGLLVERGPDAQRPGPLHHRRTSASSLTGGEGAAGSTYYELTLTNTSGHVCRTGGFGGVSLVGDGNGTQIGAPADRTEPGKVRAITLQPDGRAAATLRVTNAENYSPSKCDPAPAEGFRVYPPNETHAAYVAQGSTGCRNDTVHLLTLTPYQPVG